MSQNSELLNFLTYLKTATIPHPCLGVNEVSTPSGFTIR